MKIPKEFEVIEGSLENGIWYDTQETCCSSVHKLCVDRRGNLHIIDIDWYFDERFKKCPCKRKNHYRKSWRKIRTK